MQVSSQDVVTEDLFNKQEEIDANDIQNGKANGQDRWEPPSAGLQFNFLSTPAYVPVHGVSLEFRPKKKGRAPSKLEFEWAFLLIGHKDPGQR